MKLLTLPPIKAQQWGGISVHMAQASMLQHSSVRCFSGVGSHILLAEGCPSVDTQLHSCAGWQATKGVRH